MNFRCLANTAEKTYLGFDTNGIEWEFVDFLTDEPDTADTLWLGGRPYKKAK